MVIDLQYNEGRIAPFCASQVRLLPVDKGGCDRAAGHDIQATLQVCWGGRRGGGVERLSMLLESSFSVEQETGIGKGGGRGTDTQGILQTFPCFLRAAAACWRGRSCR